MSNMNIAIIGPGAVGLLLAGFLHKHAKVTLVDYREERIKFLNKEGIQWEGMDNDVRFHVPVTQAMDTTSECNLAILCVKAYHTESAAKELRKSGYQGPLMTLQNGLGNVDILKAELPKSDLIAGITSEGATLVDTGHVRHAGRGKTAIGQVIPGKPDDEFLNQLVKLMKTAGLDVEHVSEVAPLIWGKLIINVGINALTGILRIQNGKLLEQDIELDD